MLPMTLLFYLIFGVTEMMHKNWSAAVSNLWIVTEQIIDFTSLTLYYTVSERFSQSILKNSNGIMGGCLSNFCVLLYRT